MSVVRTLELDFIATARHHGKQPITVCDTKWLQRGDRCRPPRPRLDHPHHLRQRRIENPGQHPCRHGDFQPGDLCPESRSPFVFGSRYVKRLGLFRGEVTPFHESRQPGEHEPVIEQQNPQCQHEVIQKRVVSRKDDADLPWRNDQKTQDVQSPRQEHHPCQPQLQCQRSHRRRRVEQVRQVLHIPADPSRQWPILVILVERCEIPPLRVAPHDLRHARFKINPEAFPHR